MILALFSEVFYSALSVMIRIRHLLVMCIRHLIIAILTSTVTTNEDFCVATNADCGKEDRVIRLEPLEDKWIDANKLIFIESSGKVCSFFKRCNIN